MSRLRLWVLSGLVLSTTSAFAKDEHIAVEPGSVKSVAIVNRVATDGLKYTNRAMTAFGNEERMLEVDWKPAQAIEEALVTTLRDAGIASSVVSLSEADEAPAFGKKCWTGWTSKYKPKCQPALDALLDRLQVDLILVLAPYRVQDYYFDSTVRVEGVGLFTFGFGDTIKQSVLVSHVQYAQYSRKGALDSLICTSTEIDAKRTFTATPNTLSGKDLDWAKPEFERLFDENAKRSLRSSGVLPGGFEKCPLGWGRPH